MACSRRPTPRFPRALSATEAAPATRGGLGNAQRQSMASGPILGERVPVVPKSPPRAVASPAPVHDAQARLAPWMNGAAAGGMAACRWMRGDESGAQALASGSFDAGVGYAAGAAERGLGHMGWGEMGAKSGAAALISGGASIWQNARAVNDGESDGVDATADVLVDTGIGMAAMAAGTLATTAALPFLAATLGPGLALAGAGMALGCGVSIGTSMLLEQFGGEGAREGIGRWLSPHSDAIDSGWEGLGEAMSPAFGLVDSMWGLLPDDRPRHIPLIHAPGVMEPA